MSLGTNEINQLKNHEEKIKILCGESGASGLIEHCNVIKKASDELTLWGKEVSVGAEVKEELIAITNELMELAENTKIIASHIGFLADDLTEANKI